MYSSYTQPSIWTKTYRKVIMWGTKGIAVYIFVAYYKVTNCTVNTFFLECDFDRFFTFELFEYLRHYRQLLAQINGWLQPKGKSFFRFLFALKSEVSLAFSSLKIVYCSTFLRVVICRRLIIQKWRLILSLMKLAGVVTNCATAKRLRPSWKARWAQGGIAMDSVLSHVLLRNLRL